MKGDNIMGFTGICFLASILAVMVGFFFFSGVFVGPDRITDFPIGTNWLLLAIWLVLMAIWGDIAEVYTLLKNKSGK